MLNCINNNYKKTERTLIFGTRRNNRRYNLPKITSLIDNGINVILDRNPITVKSFQDEYFVPDLTEEQKVKAMELLEMLRCTNVPIALFMQRMLKKLSYRDLMAIS